VFLKFELRVENSDFFLFDCGNLFEKKKKKEKEKEKRDEYTVMFGGI